MKTITIFEKYAGTVAGQKVDLLSSLLFGGLLTIFLAACDSGGSASASAPAPDPAPAPAPAPATISPVAGVKAIPDENKLLLSWTNPQNDDIIGFRIVWFNTDNRTENGAISLMANDSGVNVSAGSSMQYTLSGLTDGNNHNVRVVIIYSDGREMTSEDLTSKTGKNTDKDELPDSDDPGR